MKRLGMRATAAVLIAAGVLALGGCEEPATFRQHRIIDPAPSTQGGEAAGESAPKNDAKNQPVEITDSSTLNNYLAYAALNNPALEAAFERWKAAMAAIPQARSLADPQFTFQYFIVPQAMRDGDWRFTYELTQAFPWFGKLQLQGDMADKEAQAAFARYEQQRLNLFASVKAAYYEYQYLTRAVAITQENLQTLGSIEAIARSRYETSGGNQADVIRSQVELGKLENELASMKDMLVPIGARLNAALGRAADAPLPKTLPAGAEVEAAPDEAQLLAWTAKASPDLQALAFDIDKQRTGIDLARTSYFPDFMLGVELDQMTQAPGFTSTPPNPIAVMASLNIPIWWEKYAAAVRQANANYAAAVGQRKDRLNSLASEIKMEAFNFRNAARKAALYRDVLVPKATTSLKSTQASYQTGASGFTDFVETQRTLLEFQLSQERAISDRQQALARLEALVGRSAATTTHPATKPAG